ncbi:hypothetical protein SEA_CLOWN_84 [Gordonia phage Clown]|uniref:Uncharacterized protein n=1 Tax=Gordonia phage Clown TaxID=2759393 RepID=A0A7L7SI21_9CAUD|nr:hypothetical protein KNV25_gp84 [Gordonia phage Clown]QOC56082.1 hypothetical protein SEA_CLOWN_84 [Gordonia phage Clown]
MEARLAVRAAELNYRDALSTNPPGSFALYDAAKSLTDTRADLDRIQKDIQKELS